MNEKLTYSVLEIFSSFLADVGASFYNIPDYQRGYKWTSGNIRELLDDVLQFHRQLENKENSDAFYCLQNITLSKSQQQETTVLNVIDGQQRLTTLVLLLAYLQENELVSDKLMYSIRKNTHRFIQDHIVSRGIWNQTPKPEQQDQHYLIEVASEIKTWFVTHETDEKFKQTLLHRVHLIVNLLDGQDEEQAFANLNGAKVNLDGADLMRAVLMTHAAKERFGENPQKEEVNEFRVRMGIELDEINRWWGQKEVGKFFRQMLPGKITEEARSNGMSLNNFPINILYALIHIIHHSTDSQKCFCFKTFEYGLDIDQQEGNDQWELYAEIRKVHLEMQEWYTNQQIYHYLGFLFAQDKVHTDFAAIYEAWTASATKEAFVSTLKSRAAALLTRHFQNDENPQSETDLCQSLYQRISDTTHNWYGDDALLFACLILLDVILITGNKSKSINALPVDYFGKNDEDKEHIGCQTPNEKDYFNKEKWMKCLEEMKLYHPEKAEEYDSISENLSDGDISEQKVKMLVNLINGYGLNSIGNMVLLNLAVNRGYRNDTFADKRSIIIENFYKRKYIRPHTLRTFLKDFPGSDGLEKEWTYGDIANNAKAIAKELAHFCLYAGGMKASDAEKLINEWEHGNQNHQTTA